MKKTLLIIGLILLFLAGAGLYFIKFSPATDIRPSYLKKGPTEADYSKGKALISQMEAAYGSRERWIDHQEASYIQRAEWYGKLKISGWDTLPQRFEMRAILGSMDCEMKLLNGHRSGTSWVLQGDQCYQLNPDGEQVLGAHEGKKEKMIFKNYWFQFPFRIGEAQFICYAGSKRIQEVEYEVVYATWGSMEANKDYDQFLLYIHPESHRVEYLHFTVREKSPVIVVSARFADFKAVGDLVLPHSQFVFAGKPGNEGIKLHENHYEQINLGK